MLNFVPEKMFLRGFLLHYERAKSGLHDSKVVILAWKKENVLGSQKSLKMKNWKHYSMKIVAKHKKTSQNLWDSLKQPFQNV